MEARLINIDRQTFDPFVVGIINILVQVFSVIWIINNLSWDNFWYGLVYILIMSSVPSIFAHRAWSHRSWTPSRYLNLFGLLLYTVGLIGTSIAFVAIHRQHHRYTDLPGDPHSPHLRSRMSIQFWIFSKVDVSWIRNCIDLLRDPDHLWFAKYYWHINVLFWGILYLISPIYFAMILAFNGFIMIKAHAVNSLLHNSPRWIFPINYSGHGPSNSLVFNILAIGSAESWHKNHHDDPTNWSVSKRWYEFDPSAMWITLFVYLGWATIPQRKAV